MAKIIYEHKQLTGSFVPPKQSFDLSLSRIYYTVTLRTIDIGKHLNFARITVSKPAKPKPLTKNRYMFNYCKNNLRKMLRP